MSMIEMRSGSQPYGGGWVWDGCRWVQGGCEQCGCSWDQCQCGCPPQRWECKPCPPGIRGPIIGVTDGSAA